MKITIECECGNRITMSAPEKKYLQFRDNLETEEFRYDGAVIKDGELKEFRICCDRCHNWVTLGVD